VIAVIARRTTLAVAGLTVTALLAGPAPSAVARPVVAAHVSAHHSHHAVHGRQPRPVGSVELTWAPTYMANHDDPNAMRYTHAEAMSMARRFNLIGAIPVAFQQYVADMKAANPNLTILSYANATFLAPSMTAGIPKSEFAKDVHGNQIRSTTFHTILMNPASPKWRRRTVKTCQSLAKLGGYDGCIVDLLTMGVFAKHFVTALPVNPHTGKVYTELQWRRVLVKLAHQYVRRDSRQIIVGNSVGNVFRYFLDPVSSQPLVNSLPGAQMEDFLRGATTGLNRFPNVKQWLENVHVISSIEDSGRTGLFSTKLWGKTHHAQVAAWQAYSMASFLMAANGHSYFAFTDQRSKIGAMETDLPFRMPKKTLGKPKGGMKHVGSVYIRRFRHGLAVVNPTRSSHKVTLGRKYTDLQGKRVSHLVLHAHSGNVFVKKKR
jgi:putative glycosyl hydrolase-like family 15 (GHL15) protein